MLGMSLINAFNLSSTSYTFYFLLFYFDNTSSYAVRFTARKQMPYNALPHTFQKYKCATQRLLNYYSSAGYQKNPNTFLTALMQQVCNLTVSSKCFQVEQK